MIEVKTSTMSTVRVKLFLSQPQSLRTFRMGNRRNKVKMEASAHAGRDVLQGSVSAPVIARSGEARS
jgi:hypothetical protein